MDAAARRKQQQQSPGNGHAAELLRAYLSSDDDAEVASRLLSGLEAEHSLLAGMFRSFLKEAGHPVSSTAPAHAPAAPHGSPPSPGCCTKRRRNTELLLHVTLEDLYQGCVKQVAVQRQRTQGAMRTSHQEQLSVCVQPGLQEGARITLPGLGPLDARGGASDLTLIVTVDRHPTYRRLANDLYSIVTVPLVTALTGGTVALRTLGGATLALPLGDGVIPHGRELVLPDQGMPIFGDAAGRRGALHVRVHVTFPGSLSSAQQAQLRAALAGCDFDRPLSAAACSPRISAALPAVGALPPVWPRLQQQQQHQHQQSTAGSGASSSIAGFACTHSTSSSRGSGGYGLQSVPLARPWPQQQQQQQEQQQQQQGPCQQPDCSSGASSSGASAAPFSSSR